MSDHTPDSPFAPDPEEQRPEPPPGSGAPPTPASPFADSSPIQNAYAPPQTAYAASPAAGTAPDNGISTLVPYKNPPALIAYYLGLFSLLPCVGLLLAIPAVILGIIGLKKRRENPAIHGTVHAWIGIIMGTILGLIWGAVLLAMGMGMLASVLSD